MLKIGHRGASGYAPENTLSSIKKALELEVDMIEVDVRLCKTGRVVLMHDPTINRTTKRKGKVSEKTLHQLKKLGVPTLEQVLNLINRKTKVNVEIKEKLGALPVLKIIEKYVKEKNWTYSMFLVSSFQHQALEQISKLNPKIKLGILTKKKPLKLLDLAKQIKAYSMNIKINAVNKKNIQKIKKNKLKILVWTVNKKRNIKRMKKLGVDGIISDFPDRII